MYFLCILRSTPIGCFYVGQSQDVAQRLAYHNAGCSKALKHRGPWEPIYTEAEATRAEAVRR